jgi:hypothetical protein
MDLMSGIDNSVPHSARIFTYWLGGNRQAGESFMSTFPQIVDLARTGRHFLARVVRHLAGEAGIRQFLDIGSGLLLECPHTDYAPTTIIFSGESS